MTAQIEITTPTRQDAKMAAETVKRLSAYLDRPEDVRIQLGQEGEQESHVVPEVVVRLLSQILTETARGHAVSVVAIESEMGTSEAADYLNVSAPYAIGLMEQGMIPFPIVGAVRRLRFQDVAEYKTKKMAISYAAMEELQTQADELDMEL